MNRTLSFGLFHLSFCLFYFRWISVFVDNINLSWGKWMSGNGDNTFPMALNTFRVDDRNFSFAQYFSDAIRISSVERKWKKKETKVASVRYQRRFQFDSNRFKWLHVTHHNLNFFFQLKTFPFWRNWCDECVVATFFVRIKCKPDLINNRNHKVWCWWNVHGKKGYPTYTHIEYLAYETVTINFICEISNALNAIIHGRVSTLKTD